MHGPAQLPRLQHPAGGGRARRLSLEACAATQGFACITEQASTLADLVRTKVGQVLKLICEDRIGVSIRSTPSHIYEMVGVCNGDGSQALHLPQKLDQSAVIGQAGGHSRDTILHPSNIHVTGGHMISLWAKRKD